MADRSDFQWQSCNEHVVGEDVSSVGEFPETCYECHQMERIGSDNDE